MKAYVVNFNPLVLQAQEILRYFDTRNEILNWYMPFQGTVLIASNQNRTAIANMIATRFHGHHFLIIEANTFNTDGRLLSQAWEFISTPKSSGRWDAEIGGLLK